MRERYGEEEVEHLLDACHALMNVGVDRYKRPPSSRSQGSPASGNSAEYLQAR